MIDADEAVVTEGAEPWAGRPAKLTAAWLPSPCDMPPCGALVATEADGMLLEDQMRQYVLCHRHVAAVRYANPSARLVPLPRH